MLRRKHPGRTNNYDYVIIGGGIAGLYAAKRLYESGQNVIVLEASERIGGRALQFKWHDTQIKLGAGIIRQSDKHLIKLCNEMGLPLQSFDQTVKIFGPNMNATELRDIIQIVKARAINDPAAHSMTFSDYLRECIGAERAKIFLHQFGYKDMLQANAWDTIFNYSIDDVILDTTRYYIGERDGIHGWNLLISELCVGYPIHVNSGVQHIRQSINSDRVAVHTANRVYEAKNIVFATDVAALRRIIAASPIDSDAFDFLHEIDTVPFTRGFSYYANGMQKPAGFNITEDTNRFIPFNDKVIMSIYDDAFATDNPDVTSEKYWHELADQRMMKYGVATAPADDFVYKYWPVGIHYYKPRYIGDGRYIIPRDQLLYKWAAPTKNIFICGEMISLSQGWVNGAIESVDRIMDIIEDRESPFIV
jgi:monoamine oxidase